MLAWISVQNMQPSGVLRYTGTDHGCSTGFEQCYWTDLQVAQRQCGTWSECKYLYQSDEHSPATAGNPVYWARGHGEGIYEEGAVLWEQEGNTNYVYTEYVALIYVKHILLHDNLYYFSIVNILIFS